MSRILLVGEQNPYGGDPFFALYPLPEQASGGRLARILGLSRTDYLRIHDRVNLCSGAWDAAEARRSAGEIISGRPRGSGVVLLGRKVERAFGWVYKRYETRLVEPGLFMLSLPHPSGFCREWNDPANTTRARAAWADLRRRVEIDDANEDLTVARVRQ